MELQDRPKKLRKRIPGKRVLVTSYSKEIKTIEITEPIVKEFGEFAEKQKVKLYIVGGYVRDHYLGRPRADFDFTVVGDSIDFAEKLAKKYKTKAVIYPRFRTALVPIGEHHYEFVGTRKEEYLPDSRKPIVKEGTLLDDLRRRDFTINAMAVSVNPDSFGELTDIFDGLKDLERCILKTPLDPFTTFSDDPLRMMRAARFAAQINFTIEPRTLAAIRAMHDRISIVSQERITDEILKLLGGKKPAKGFKILQETGLLRIVFPELDNLKGIEVVKKDGKEYAHKDVFNHTLKVVDKLAEETDDLWLRFAALVHDIAKPKTKKFIEGTGWSFHGHEELGARWMGKMFRKMKLPLDHLPYVENMVRLHQRPMALVDEVVTDSAIRRLAVHAGDALKDLFQLCRADITTNNPKLNVRYLNNYNRVAQKVMDVQEKDKLREFQSPVRGEEIMEICNLQPSKAVGIIKHNIEEAILDGIIPNEYDAAKEYFMKYKDEWLEEISN
jgi:putative nucleotidyltransferase with HDIG domain